MANAVLVTYASKYGATKEIAEKIGSVLEQEGVACEIAEASGVSDPGRYRAIVLGSGVYIGKWLKGAVKFLKENEEALAKVPVWFFSSGPTDEGDPVELVKGWTFPAALKPIAENIGAKDMKVFHGVNDPGKMSGLHKWMIKKVKAAVGDFRDWDAIVEWAKGIAAELTQHV